MIKVKIILGEMEVDMHSISYGEKASFTDYTNSPNGEIFIVTCDSDEAVVHLSKLGIHEEVGTIRAVTSFDLSLEKKFDTEYRRKYKTKHGEAVLVLTFEKEIIN